MVWGFSHTSPKGHLAGTLHFCCMQTLELWLAWGLHTTDTTKEGALV